MNKKKRNPFSLYVYNPIEDEWGYISSFPKKAHNKLIHDSNRFADSYLFANSLLTSFTFISPILISDEFKEYFESLSGVKCQILIPTPSTPFISYNCARDKKIFNYIVSEAKKTEEMNLYAYAITPEIYALQKKIERQGVKVILPEAPLEKDSWTISDFGSKSGFRKYFSKWMPQGVVKPDYKKAIKAAEELYPTAQGVVIKTDKGNAGQGVHIFKKEKQRTTTIFVKELSQLFKKEAYLKKHKIIVEEYINTTLEKKSPFPSVEFFIHQSGMIEMQYYCNMIITASGEFYGMEMHKNVFSKKVRQVVLNTANQIAEKYRDCGYRGRFDIDMIWNGKKIYANESNTRSTGGTDTYVIVKKIIGNKFFTERYILSSYIDLPKKISPLFSSIKKACAPLLFDARKKIGIIINSESVIKNDGFSYVVIGKNKKETTTLHKQLKTMLTNYKKKE